MLRRTIGWFVTVMLLFILGWQMAWHWKADIWPELEDNFWSSFGMLVLVFLALAGLMWAVLYPKWWRVLLAFALGGIAATFREMFSGISWTSLALVFGSAAVLFVLWAFTVLDDSVVRRWIPRRSAAVPVPTTGTP